jgi:hypothetical protein
MTLSALIQKSGLQDFANANSANSANEAWGEPGSLARLATLALANPGSEKTESPLSPQSPHSLTENDPGRNAPLDLTREDHHKEVLARRFKVTLTGGKVLLHSAPSGLTRREAIELSKDWGEVAECVPVFTPLEVSKPVPLDLTLAAATAGLPITAEQFRFSLSQDDLADIAAELIPVECLRAYAELVDIQVLLSGT